METNEKLTSFNLRYGKLQIDEIKTHVREILEMIDDSILEAHEKCETRVIIPLPFNFDIPHLRKADARKKIYSLVIEDLTSPNRGFVVHLKYVPNQTASLVVTWFTEEDELLHQHEEDIIKFYGKPLDERHGLKRPQSIPFEERIKQYASQKN